MQALAPIPRLRLLRRNSTAGFAPRDREEKRIWRSGSQKRTEQTLKNTQRDAKNKSKHPGSHLLCVKGRIILAYRLSRKKLTTRLRSSNMWRPRYLTHYSPYMFLQLRFFLVFIDSVSLRFDKNYAFCDWKLKKDCLQKVMVDNKNNANLLFQLFHISF